MEQEVAGGDTSELNDFRHQVDNLFSKVNKLEERVNEVDQLSTCKTQPSNSKHCPVAKDKDKHIPSMKKQRQEAAHREAVAAKRMQELMRHFGTILRQICQHKWAWPFMQPVDVHGLGLDDYFEVIDRPMDFSTIKNQMEVNDDTGYKNVRDIYADVRLVFDNAMRYNDEQTDVHQMAKTLLSKFEEKWLQLLPKVTEEERRREEEEEEVLLDKQLVKEVSHAKMARDLSTELHEVDVHLEEIKELLVQKCRKMTSREKRKLGAALSQMSPENLRKALEIVTHNNPSFHASAEEVDLDISAQSESTLWRLKFFVKDVSEVEANKSEVEADKSVSNVRGDKKNASATANSKRKKEICNISPKSGKKQNKKVCSAKS